MANIDTQTEMLKMNAGEQSFNHMPFIIDYINELIVQLDYNKITCLKVDMDEINNSDK